MKNIPKQIFLQVDPECENTEDFNDLYEVSWCSERINNSDIKFLLSDVVFSEAELKAKLDEQKEEHRQWLKGEGYELLAERL